MADLWYYIEGVKESLQSQLKSKLSTVAAKQLQDRGLNHNTTDTQWALVHKCRAGDKAIRGKLSSLHLVVYLNEAQSRCVLEIDADYKPSQSCQYWLAGTLFVIDDFDSLKSYVEASSPEKLKDLAPSDWIRPRHTLIALDILCQGFRVAHEDTTLLGISGIGSQSLQGLSLQARATEKDAWWLGGLGVASLNELKIRLCVEKVSTSACDTIIREIGVMAQGKITDPNTMMKIVQAVHKTVKEELKS
ncbi:MAG: hypothetical protein WCT12_15615 [Verrucomicrobiota bacterium]